MDRLFDILAILGIVLVIIVMRSLRREHIRVEHSVSWLAAAITLLVLSRSHRLLTRGAAYIGLDNEAAPLVLGILAVFLGVFYRFSRIVSGLKDMNITLTQRVAILEYKLHQKNEEQEAKS